MGDGQAPNLYREQILRFHNYNYYNAGVVINRLEHFFKVEENISILKAHKATLSVANFYNAGVVICT
jgi:hypothetical protein